MALTSKCDLMDVGQASAGCEEELSGLGNQIFVALPEDLESSPSYAEGKAAFESSAFTFKKGKGAYKIRIKKQSGQITATGNEGAKGYSVQLVFTVDKDVDNAAQVLRILKNKGDAIFFTQNPKGGYIVVYDPIYGTSINNNYDTGNTPDSDSGHTVTVTCNPCPYSRTTWDGTLTIASQVVTEGSEEDDDGG